MLQTGAGDRFYGEGVQYALAIPRTSAGVQAAIDKIYASGKPGVVVWSPMPYTIDEDITLREGVSHFGALGALDFAGLIPDANPRPKNGTILNIAPGVTALKYNNVGQPNPVPAQLADTSASGITIAGLNFVGGLRGIHTGEKNVLGLTFSEVKNCRFYDQTEEHYVFENFMQCNFGNLFCWNSLPGVVAGGMVFDISRLKDAGGVNALLPGNSCFSGILFGWTNQFLGRGFSFNGLDGQLNECSFKGRVQFNRHASQTTAVDIEATMANTSANFTVSDPAQFALCQVGMPLAIPHTGSAVGAVNNGVVHFVSSRDPATNTITLNETPRKTTGNLTATTNGSVTLKCGGFPGLEVCGDDTGAVTSVNLGDLDLECKGAVATMVCRNVKATGHILEIMPSDTQTGIAPRNCDLALTYVGAANITNDTSSSHGNFRATNLAGGTVNYNGGSFVLDTSHNGQVMRYSGASDITITYSRTLPKGFKHKTVCTSTGQITYTPANAQAIPQNRSATAKTAGGTAPQANIELISVTAGGTTFHIWGDLGG